MPRETNNDHVQDRDHNLDQARNRYQNRDHDRDDRNQARNRYQNRDHDRDDRNQARNRYQNRDHDRDDRNQAHNRYQNRDHDRDRDSRDRDRDHYPRNNRQDYSRRQHGIDNQSQSKKRENDNFFTRLNKRQRVNDFIEESIREIKDYKINDPDMLKTKINEKLALDSLDTIELIEKRIKDLSLFIQNNKEILKKEHGKAESIENVIVESMIQYAVSALNAKITEQVNTQEFVSIPFLFYNLGQFALYQYRFIKLPTKSLAELITAVCSTSDESIKNGKNIAMSIYSLGLLGHAHSLEGTFSIDFINQLLIQFCELKKESRQISNVIYGLGQMANAGYLKGIVIPKDLIDQLLTQSCKLESTAQDRSNLIYGLGQLAHAECLKDIIIPNEIVDLLLTQFCKLKLNTQDISNFIYGLGQSAHAGCLKGTIISEKVVDHLLTQFCKLELNTQAISNLIYGLGKLAHAGCLKDITIPKEVVDHLLTQFCKLEPNAQGISNLIYGLGLLAQAGCLKGITIPKEIFDYLLTQFCKLELTAQHISNFIYGLGQLAHAGCLKGIAIPEEIIVHLFTQLCELEELAPQEISNFIYGLGRLADAGNLKNVTIPTKFVNQLLTQFCNLQPTSQNISNLIYGLGFLAEKKQLDKNFQQELIVPLISRLLKSDATTQDNYQCLISLLKLAKTKHLNLSGINRSYNNCIKVLFEKTKNRFLSFNKKYTKARIKYLADLVQYTSDASFLKDISPKTIFALITPYTKSFLHPSTAAKLLNSLIIFYEKDPRFAIPSDLFTNLVEAIDVPIKHFDSHTQEHLKESLSKLEELSNDYFMLLNRQLYPPNETESEALVELTTTTNFSSSSLERLQGPHSFPSRSEGHPRREAQNRSQDQSSQPRETPSTVRNRIPAAVRQSAQPITRRQAASSRPPKNIYECLKTGDLDSLVNFLNSLGENIRIKQSDLVKLATPAHPSTSKYSNTNPLVKENQPSQGRLKKNKVDEAVSDFFEKTPISDLKNLIKDGNNAKSFSLLIKKCSEKQRYELAKNSHLYLVIRYLPFDDLVTFIKNCYSVNGFGLYCDSNVVNKLCDALTIRAIKENNQKNERIRNLRDDFLERAIKHHGTRNNRHVLERLNDLKENYLKENYCLLSDDDEDEIQTIEAPVTPVALSSPPTNRVHNQSVFASPSVTPRPSRTRSMPVSDNRPRRVAQTSAPTTTATRVPQSNNNPNHPRQRQPLKDQASASVPISTATATMVREQQAVVPSATEIKVNTAYQYESEDMDKFSKLRLKNIPDVEVLAGMKLKGIVVRGHESNRPVDVLKNFVDQNPNHPESFVIIPIEMNDNHWVGLKLHLKNKKITQASYFNPQENPDVDSWVIEFLQKSFSDHSFFENDQVKITQEDCLQQKDSSSCGPSLIEGMYCSFPEAEGYIQFLRENEWKSDEDLIVFIRRRHLMLLKQDNEDDFNIFHKKQFRNINTVASTREQLRKHGIYSDNSGNTQKITIGYKGKSVSYQINRR